MAKRKKPIFSATQAVKANARERLGSPPPSHPLPTPKEKAARRKNKPSLAELLSVSQDGQGSAVCILRRSDTNSGPGQQPTC